MASRELRKFLDRPVLHTLLRTWQISQATNPIRRLADANVKRGKLREAADVARVLYATRAAWKTLEVVDGKKLLTDTGNVLREDVKIGPITLPAGAFAGVAAAGAVAVVESLVRLEKDREKTALADAPLEAQKIRNAYDAQVTRQAEVKVGGKKVAVNGAQELAHEYAEKTLAELEAVHGKKKVQKAVKAAEALVGVAYDPANSNPEVHAAIQAVAGDAFEAVLVEKEVPETAATITKRPQDALINGGHELARKGARALEKVEKVWLVGGVAKALTPKFVDKAISTLAGDKPLASGNLSLDPRAFINAGSEKTQALVREELEKHFSEFIAAEQAVGATGMQIRVLNDLLPTGPKLSETAKDEFMNLVLASVLVRRNPQFTPVVAGITGVMDTYQNNPARLGSEFAPKKKTRRRR